MLDDRGNTAVYLLYAYTRIRFHFHLLKSKLWCLFFKVDRTECTDQQGGDQQIFARTGKWGSPTRAFKGNPAGQADTQILRLSSHGAGKPSAEQDLRLHLRIGHPFP